MLQHLGYSCWISYDGNAIQHYNEEVKGSIKTAWIPSEAGKTFSVSWNKTDEQKIATSGHVFIDGKDVASAIMRPGRTKAVERSGAKCSSRTIKPFTFSCVNLTDDEGLAQSVDQSVKDIGTIAIQISRVKLGAEVPFKSYEVQNRDYVHEKAKKAGAHCTSFGPTQRTERPRTVAVSTAPYDPKNPGPYVTFIFKYRSEEILKANGIIPRLRKRVASDSGGEDDIDREVIVIDSDAEDESTQREASNRSRKGDDKHNPAKRMKLEDAVVRPVQDRDTSPIDPNDVIMTQSQPDKPQSSEGEVEEENESSEAMPRSPRLFDGFEERGMSTPPTSSQSGDIAMIGAKKEGSTSEEPINRKNSPNERGGEAQEIREARAEADVGLGHGTKQDDSVDREDTQASSSGDGALEDDEHTAVMIGDRDENEDGEEDDQEPGADVMKEESQLEES